MYTIYNKETITKKEAEAILLNNPELLSYGFDLKHVLTTPSNAGITLLNEAIKQASEDTETLSLGDKEVFKENLHETIKMLEGLVASKEHALLKIEHGMLIDEQGNDLKNEPTNTVLESDHLVRLGIEPSLEVSYDDSVYHVVNGSILDEKLDYLNYIKTSLEHELETAIPLDINVEQNELLNDLFHDTLVTYELFSLITQ